MNVLQGNPRALFPSPDGSLLPDWLVCSGRAALAHKGRPCGFSEAKRIPLPRPLDENTVRLHPERGKVGDLSPPCVLEHYGSLEAWLGGDLGHLPPELGPLRLFRCRQWSLLVVPGLRDDRPGTRDVNDPEGSGATD